MPKRKLSELNGPSRLDTRKLTIKAVRLTTKFEQGVQILAKALKTARGFERQKLSRREKTAKTEGNRPMLVRLAEEVDALKAIDYPITAERYLFKQLLKTKRIAESPTFREFQEAKNVSTEGPKSAAESNVHGRLFKSTPVKNVMPEIMNGIRKLLGVEDAPVGKGKSDAKKDAPKKEKPAAKMDDGSGSEFEGEEPKKPRKSSTDKDQEPNSADGEDQSVSGDEDFDSEDLAQFDARLAPGSDFEEESGSEHDNDNTHKQDLADDISDSISRSPSPDYSAEDSPPSKKTKGAKASKDPAQSTTFLPSLTMGGYWSGSEEEATDDEAAAGPPKRKNRMGQQARRALWEKKYGAGANHIREEQRKQKYSRDSGWDTRKGATGSASGRGGDRGGRGGFGAGRSQNRFDDRSGGGQSYASKPRAPPKDTGPLHPSWEAKRKLKEQTSTAKFEGKKVVFD